MPRLLAEIIITCITIVIEIALFISSAEIPEQSGTYPRFLIGLAFVLSVAFLLMCLMKAKKQGLGVPENHPVPGAALQITVLCVIVAAYLMLLEFFGYLIMTLVFILACLLYLGMRNKLVLVCVPVLVTGFTYYLFNNILFVFLPRGIWG